MSLDDLPEVNPGVALPLGCRAIRRDNDEHDAEAIARGWEIVLPEQAQGIRGRPMRRRRQQSGGYYMTAPSDAAEHQAASDD
jgi:hypothetical protein